MPKIPKKNTSAKKAKVLRKKPDLRVKKYDEMVFSFTHVLDGLVRNKFSAREKLFRKHLLKKLGDIENGPECEEKRALEQAKRNIQKGDLRILRELSARKIIFGEKKE